MPSTLQWRTEAALNYSMPVCRSCAANRPGDMCNQRNIRKLNLSPQTFDIPKKRVWFWFGIFVRVVSESIANFEKAISKYKINF